MNHDRISALLRRAHRKADDFSKSMPQRDTEQSTSARQGSSAHLWRMGKRWTEASAAWPEGKESFKGGFVYDDVDTFRAFCLANQVTAIHVISGLGEFVLDACRGLDIKLSDNWNMSTYVTAGYDHDHVFTVGNAVDTANLAAALRSSDPATALNPFGTSGGNSAAMRALTVSRSAPSASLMSSRCSRPNCPKRHCAAAISSTALASVNDSSSLRTRRNDAAAPR